jgi:hypothetical protein
MGKKKPVVYCPECGEKARRSETQYGYRHECCGLHSWGSKPLVSKQVHELRQKFHEAFDPIWKRRLMSRGKAYAALSSATGLPEPECHGARQVSPEKLQRLIAAARTLSQF